MEFDELDKYLDISASEGLYLGALKLSMSAPFSIVNVSSVFVRRGSGALFDSD